MARHWSGAVDLASAGEATLLALVLRQSERSACQGAAWEGSIRAARITDGLGGLGAASGQACMDAIRATPSGPLVTAPVASGSGLTSIITLQPA